jgi:ribosome-associated protein
MLDIDHVLSQCLREVTFDLVRASGPGGQNMNKVATAVQLRFDAAHSPRLGAGARRRLLRLAGRRATAAGVIVIQASRYRTQKANRQDALDRLHALLLQALIEPKKRLRTKATAASKERRLKAKKVRSEVKRSRRGDAG